MMKRYTDVLRNRQFIQWQLALDEEFEAYWSEDIQLMAEDDSLSFQNDVEVKFDENEKKNQIFIMYNPLKKLTLMEDAIIH